jgi:uncharacterized protein (DUF3820 family)
MINIDKDVVIPFGKFKGKVLEEINSGYLRWLAEEEWFEKKYPELIEPVEDELNWRTTMNRHFYDEFSG